MVTVRLHWGNANGNRHDYSPTQLTKMADQVTYPVGGSSRWYIGLPVESLPMTASAELLSPGPILLSNGNEVSSRHSAALLLRIATLPARPASSHERGRSASCVLYSVTLADRNNRSGLSGDASKPKFR